MNMKYTLANLIYLLISQSVVAAGRIRPRVVGGVEDVGGEFPFAVMLQDLYPPMLRTCSGSLISLSWVLTAAHCTPDVPNYNENTSIPMRVKYGDRTIPSNVTKFYAIVVRSIKHPGYNRRDPSRFVHDIGLLKIERISSAPIGKLSAVDYRSVIGLPVKYAGFGRSELLLKGDLTDMMLGKIDVRDIDPPLLVGEAVVITCPKGRDEDTGGPDICLAPRCGPRQHLYFGDSGGPLLLSGRIIGVGSSMAESTPLFVFTAVSPYLDWIYDTVHSD